MSRKGNKRKQREAISGIRPGSTHLISLSQNIGISIDRFACQKNFFGFFDFVVKYSSVRVVCEVGG
jgi:hypothetical protein